MKCPKTNVLCGVLIKIDLDACSDGRRTYQSFYCQFIENPRKAVPDRDGDMFSSGEFNPMRLKAKAQHSDTLSSHMKFRYINLSSKFTINLFSFKTSQELRMLFRSLSDCQSLILNFMIGVRIVHLTFSSKWVGEPDYPLCH